MKTDRREISAAIVVFLAGMAVVLVGCVSSPTPSVSQVSDADGEPPNPPDDPLYADAEPKAPQQLVAITHAPTVPTVPAVPHPDAVWRVPSPEVVHRSSAPEVVVALPEPYPPEPYPRKLRQELSDRVVHPPTAPGSSFRSASSWVPPLPAPPAGSEDRSLEVPLIALETAPLQPISDIPTAEEGINLPQEPTDPADVTRTRITSTGSEFGPSAEGPSAEGPLVEQGPSSIDRPSVDEPDLRSSDGEAAPQRVSPSASRPAPQRNTTAQRTVEEGEQFQVSLPGRGWVYVGGAEELQFIERVTAGEKVMFSFRGSSTGGETEERVTLEFASYDLTTGSQARHEEQILIAAAEDDGGTEQAETAGFAEASGAGGIPEGRPENQEAASYEELLQQVNELEESQDHQAAVDLLEEMRADTIGDDDEITFRLAQLYETEWVGRDLRRARDLYQTVVESYPLSRWRRPARERIEHLNRHFFHIR